MSAPLYRWPEPAKFGRVVPKTKFYEHATISATIREKFVAEVQRITWAYKLADETIHLRGDDSVPEIQVFTIDVKNDDVSNDVLTAIDKAIPFPIIFEIIRSAQDVRMTAAHKRLGAGSPRLSDYLSAEWLPDDAERVPLPTAINLPALYDAILTPLVPFLTHIGEEMSVVTERMKQASKLDREIARLEKKIQTEPQFNRKVGLRRELQERTTEREALLSATPNDSQNTSTEDEPWTN